MHTDGTQITPLGGITSGGKRPDRLTCGKGRKDRVKATKADTVRGCERHIR